MTTPPAFANSPVVSTVDDRFLTLQQLSAYAALSVRYLQKLIKDKAFKAYLFGRQVRVRKSDFDRWAEESQDAARAALATATDDERRIARELRGYREGRH